MSTNTPPRMKRGLNPEDMAGLGSEREVESEGMHSVLAKAEIDQQIATAHAYPRSLKKFMDECLQMATLNETVAEECIYAVPRDGKTIEGPSARLAEIVASAWRNCRAGARIVDEGPEFVTAQGAFHDLERNVAITYEVRRRITGKTGKRYSADMIATTGNAACSIALRNAVFKGIPKAFWSSIYEAARKAAVGNAQTIANKRSACLSYLQKLGATPAMVFSFLGVQGEADMTLDHIATLRGIANAVREQETTIEEALAPKRTEPAKVDLGDIPLEPKTQAAPATAAKPKSLVDQLTDAALAAGVPLDDVYLEAHAITGRTFGGSRDLKSLDEATLRKLIDHVQAFGAEPEATR